MRPLTARRVGRLPRTGMQRFFALAAGGGDVLSLGVGEPDFPTPPAIVGAGVASLTRGQTGYTPTTGIPELRAAVARHLEERYGLAYDPEREILITVGVSQGIAAALGAVVDPGDEVIVPQPCFLSYLPAVMLAGGTPVTVATRAENRFQLTADELAAAATPRTRAVLLNYPNNPTGAVLQRTTAEALARVIDERDLVLISDEIYDRLVYEGEHLCLPTLAGLRRRTVLLGGFSKAYAMTGWRLGYAAAPAELMAAMIEVHQYTVMCPPTTAQWAALAAFGEAAAAVAAMRREYRARRRLLVDGLRRLGLACDPPGGAFYAFPSVAATGLSDRAFAEGLLAEERVLVLPGSEFGAAGAGFVRCSFATGRERLEEALARIGRFLGRLGAPRSERRVAAL